MAHHIKEISTPELLNIYLKPDYHIVDVRKTDIYNGWRMNNEARGGHIPYSKSIPVKWLKYVDWIEIVRHKGILPEQTITIYGDTRADIESVASRFQNSGYAKIQIYPGFATEWLPDKTLPLKKLERYNRLVPASWVNDLIQGRQPLEYKNDKFVIVQAHYRNRDSYLTGHIPGAIDMDTLALEAPETWNRRSPQELKDALENHGITADTTVVLYGKYMFPDNADEFPGSAAGDIGAIR
jgi:molybdopterin synthase sulfurtransferase